MSGIAAFKIASVGGLLWENDGLAVESAFDDQEQAMCNGDSGAPFVMTIDSKDYLVGVVSTSIKNPLNRLLGGRLAGCHHQVREVFTSVAYHHDWIQAAIGELRAVHAGNRAANAAPETSTPRFDGFPGY